MLKFTVLPFVCETIWVLFRLANWGLTVPTVADEIRPPLTSQSVVLSELFHVPLTLGAVVPKPISMTSKLVGAWHTSPFGRHVTMASQPCSTTDSSERNLTVKQPVGWVEMNVSPAWRRLEGIKGTCPSPSNSPHLGEARIGLLASGPS